MMHMSEWKMIQIILLFVVFCCIYGCYTDYLKAVNEYS